MSQFSCWSYEKQMTHSYSCDVQV